MAGPSDAELRTALEGLLDGADLTALSYSQLHKQLEEKYQVRGVSFIADPGPLS